MVVGSTCPENTSFNFCDNFIRDGTDDDAYYLFYVVASSGDDTSGLSSPAKGTESSDGNN
jgi:hypothetical protein